LNCFELQKAGQCHKALGEPDLDVGKTIFFPTSRKKLSDQKSDGKKKTRQEEQKTPLSERLSTLFRYTASSDTEARHGLSRRGLEGRNKLTQVAVHTKGKGQVTVRGSKTAIGSRLEGC